MNVSTRNILTHKDMPSHIQGLPIGRGALGLVRPPTFGFFKTAPPHFHPRLTKCLPTAPTQDVLKFYILFIEKP